METRLKEIAKMIIHIFDAKIKNQLKVELI